MGRPRKNPTASLPAAILKKAAVLPEFFDVNTNTDTYWEVLLKRFSKTARVYGFSRVETPLLEDARLFEAFYEAKIANSLVRLPAEGLTPALRPSQLPGILRNFVQNKLFEVPSVYKWHYSGYTVKKDPRGEMVSDYEFGCEILGVFNHLSEAHCIAAAWEFLNSLGLEDMALEINNLGSGEAQSAYIRTLAEALMPKRYELCDECNEHLHERPLNVFRCNNLDCQAVVAEAPTILDFLDQESHKDFTNVLEALDEMSIAYQLNPFYAGRESQEKINFAIKAKYKGQMVSLAEGGHHSAALQALGGKQARGFGFSGSLAFVKEVMEEANIEAGRHISTEVCLVPLGELAARRSLRLFRDLTAQKILVYDHFGESGVKNQLKVAQEHKVPIALIMGQKEAMDEMVILRDVKSGMQEIISYDKIVEEVKKRLGK